MPAVEQVAAHVHVREERDVLRHVADVAMMRRQVDAVADENSTRPSIAIEPRRGVRSPAIASRIVVLPAPDGPKSAAVAGVERALAGEDERALHQLDVHVDHAARLARPDGSPSNSAANAIATDTQQQPERLGVVAGFGVRVDGDRERPRRAGDAAGDDDRRAELAERAGEARAPRRREHRRPRQRQADCEEDARGSAPSVAATCS